MNSTAEKWLPRKDSNLDKEIQNLSCYHYTTRQIEGGTYRLVSERQQVFCGAENGNFALTQYQRSRRA